MLFFARQPIFTACGNLYGYELLFRDQLNLTAANIQDQSQATSGVIVDGIAFASSHAAPNTKVFINIPEELLRSSILESISPDMCVLEILETVACTRENIEVLRHLKSLGYTLALDDYTGQREMTAFLKLVDIVKVDFRETPAQQLAGVSNDLRNRGITMLAEKVESYDEAAWAGKAGYDLLQGFYFQRPELISGKRLTSDVHTRLEILYCLTSANGEREELISLFSHSPELALRLLNFVNSAAFSVTAKIDSIKQAVVLMGVDRLCRWLSAVLIADQGRASGTTQELSILCIFRAHFLRDIAASVGYPYSEQLFALGLFSTLDAIYDTSFERLFAQASLNNEVKSALISQEGSFYPWLKAVASLEAGKAGEAKLLFTELGVYDMDEIVKKYRVAIALASSFRQIGVKPQQTLLKPAEKCPCRRAPGPWGSWRA